MTQQGKKRFVNPYNFVPLEGQCERHSIGDYLRDGSKRLTGVIECELTTLTPLIIPNTSSSKALHDAKQDAKTAGGENREVVPEQSFDFYSYTDLKNGEGTARDRYVEPVIPGSELRGVIRSVFEAAFNGCMSTADVGRELSRRSTRPKKAGILRKHHGQWVIVPCARAKLPVEPKGRRGDGSYICSRTDYDSSIEGEKVSVKTKSDLQVDVFEKGHTGEVGYRHGYLHKGEPSDNKKRESVFIPLENSSYINVSEREIERFHKALKQYGDEKINRHFADKRHSGYLEYREQFEKCKQSGEGQILVFYNLDESESAIYLSPAMYSREVYLKTIGDLLKEENGGYQPCANRNQVCPACALFGMTGASASASLGSRVRFSDAQYAPEARGSNSLSPSQPEGFMHLYQDVDLPEMGEPKPGAVEFYTFSPEPPEKIGFKYNRWTYDDYFDSKKKEIRLLKTSMPRLRGRKFYWHHIPKPASIHSANGNPNMRKKVRAVKEKVRFRFRVYFDKVTEKELAQLYWALTLGDCGKCAHKLGHGKPLGYGSVRIQPLGIQVRNIHHDTGEREVVPYDREKLRSQISTDSEAIKQLLHISDFSQVGKPDHPSSFVSYPIVDAAESDSKPNDGASHQWFKGNMKSYFQFLKVLPDIEQELGSDWRYHLYAHRSANEQCSTQQDRRKTTNPKENRGMGKNKK